MIFINDDNNKTLLKFNFINDYMAIFLALVILKIKILIFKKYAKDHFHYSPTLQFSPLSIDMK